MNSRKVDPGELLQLLARQMIGSADTGGGIAQRLREPLRIRDKLAQVRRGNGRVRNEKHRRRSNLRDRCEVLRWIVRQFLIQALCDRLPRPVSDEQCIPIGCRLGGDPGADAA